MRNVRLFTLFLNMCLFLRFVQKFTLISAFKVADRYWRAAGVSDSFVFLRRRVPTEMAARNYGRKNVKKYANCSSLDALQEFVLGIEIRT